MQQRSGERIPLVFTFTGPSDKSLTISLRNYDRSERLTLEDFAVSPAMGWTDPLAQLFAFNAAWGVVYTTRTPFRKSPLSVRKTSTNGFRFDSVGTYTIVVTSHRVSHSTKSGHPSQQGSFDIKSNSLEINIVPASVCFE
jgi:hypothetical protein